MYVCIEGKEIEQWKSFTGNFHSLCSWNTSEIVFIFIVRVLIIIFTYKLVELNVYMFHIPTFTHIIFISIILFSYYTMIFHFYATSRSYVFIIFFSFSFTILYCSSYASFSIACTYHCLKISTIFFYFLYFSHCPAADVTFEILPHMFFS